jgi:hypothetical protein
MWDCRWVFTNTRLYGDYQQNNILLSSQGQICFSLTGLDCATAPFSIQSSCD